MSVHLFEERDYNKPYVQTTPQGVVQNRIYQRVTYDHKAKDYVPDPHGELRHVATTTGLPSAAVERGAYTGGFPSRDVCDFINRMKDMMVYFDDGKRMKYTKYAQPQRVLSGLELYQLSRG
jgi:hypothetical protein